MLSSLLTKDRMTVTPSKYYLSLLLTISMIFISHAISPTSNPKLYQNVCKELGSQERQERCLKILETHPEITLAKDYSNFCLFSNKVAIEKATQSQNYIKEMMTRYPSSEAIKSCATSCYDGVLAQLQGLCNVDLSFMDLNILYAFDDIAACERGLADEKIVDISSINTLNFDMKILVDILFSVYKHLNIK
jgi:pectinesterase inhibitor-like protein